MSRFGKMLISRHMANTVCMCAAAGVKYLACDTCACTINSYVALPCLTSMQRVDSRRPAAPSTLLLLVFNFKKKRRLGGGRRERIETEGGGQV